MVWFSFVFLVFYRLLKENRGFYVEEPISDENYKSLLEQSSSRQPRLSAYALEPKIVMIERE
jgi:hypothetical protein